MVIGKDEILSRCGIITKDVVVNLTIDVQSNSKNAQWDRLIYVKSAVEALIDAQKPFQRKFLRNRMDFKEEFEQWCKKNSIKTFGVKPEAVENCGIGMVATEDIPQGKLLVLVPRKEMLTTGSLQSCPAMRHLLNDDPILSTMSNVSLTMAILYELFLGKKSHWYEYLRFLPTEYSVPLYFDEEAFSALKFSAFFDQAANVYASIVRQYSYFYQLLIGRSSPFRGTPFKETNFTFENFRWAASTVMTRINFIPFQVELSEAGVATAMNEPALIPMWDLFNHEVQALCSDYDTDTDYGRVFSVKSWSAGDQVFIHYGDRGNYELFIGGGFVVDNNPFDYFPLKLSLGQASDNYSLRMEVLKQRDLADIKVHRIFWGGDEMFQPSILQFAIVHSADVAALEEMKNLPTGTAPISEQLRLKAKSFLRNRLSLLLNTYAKLPEENDQNPSQKLCLACLDSEKQLLQHAIDALETCTFPSEI
ncbi:Histone-lysine N-methyltransferase setd3 [Trichinella papuae]|uniref:protein-histidine N-methyltransferase n=1 Tax=Trichinella papuae TaxID=268474 RepID=A0A0V1N2D3_9BILA|nr:Histone-lysine N-methyltransferase setd3 [Trichinella papuae]